MVKAQSEESVLATATANYQVAKGTVTVATTAKKEFYGLALTISSSSTSAKSQDAKASESKYTITSSNVVDVVANFDNSNEK